MFSIAQQFLILLLIFLFANATAGHTGIQVSFAIWKCKKFSVAEQLHILLLVLHNFIFFF